uniref:Odorant receptor n=1 Tax=Anomala corpulenta TaxID=931571 RepID=A0A0E3Y6Z4_9SCAR|nr:odorant receptor 29 [Anomala corpulenta]
MSFTVETLQKEDLIHVISFGTRILWVCGLYHCKHLKKHFAYNFARILVIALSLPFPCLIITGLVVSHSDLSGFLELGMFFLGSSWISIETTAQIYSLRQVAEIEEMLESDYDYFKPKTELQCQFILAKRRRLVLITQIVWFCVYSFMIIFVLCPLVTNASLVIPMWIPFGNKEFSAYLYQSFYLLILCGIYTLLHNTFLGPILMATAQFQILKDNLIHATDRSEDEDGFAQEKRIQERLKRCVKQHNAILKLVSTVQGMLAPVFLGNISFTILGICFTVLQIILATDSGNFILLTSYLGILILQMFLTCWVGNDLISETSDITQACYLSEWYNCTPSTKKMFLIIMSNTQQPISLQSIIFPVSFGTFVMILRSSYSYYTVFSQVYD